ncbi:hypothetical protein LTR04_006761 [Oleoguttula sp. CCFEE 6159]|nr:hypothetical protein LTR04_006761 [Oleoguttula sp. CCFEE 6159]
MSTNPFAPSTSKPGHGTILLALLPPNTPVLQTLSYQYPLKLIAPAAIPLPGSSYTSISTLPTATTPPPLINTIFLLTYGGGLVAGDSINLTGHLAASTRLILLTQGSTKIFKSPPPPTPSAHLIPSQPPDLTTSQHLHLTISDNAALCYLPDPVQPFAASRFTQTQIFTLSGSGNGNLCVLDWVCEGRSARGEKWAMERYVSWNEVWLSSSETDDSRKKSRLLLRDSIILDNEDGQGDVGRMGIRDHMDGLGIFGTLLLRGALFDALGRYFIDEYRLLPRIGGAKWDVPTEGPKVDDVEKERRRRQKQEAEDGLVWTAAVVRGCVVVKFGAREVEGARRWVGGMLRSEGSVERLFGERALLCLR